MLSLACIRKKNIQVAADEFDVSYGNALFGIRQSKTRGTGQHTPLLKNGVFGRFHREKERGEYPGCSNAAINVWSTVPNFPSKCQRHRILIAYVLYARTPRLVHGEDMNPAGAFVVDPDTQPLYAAYGRGNIPQMERQKLMTGKG